MQRKTNWLAIFAIVMTALFLISSGIALFNEKEVVPEGYLSPSEVNNEVTNAVEDIKGQLAVKDSKITELTNQLAEKTKEVTKEVKESLGYLIDGLILEETIEVEQISDREIKKLFDGKVEFDGENYDAEEVITLSKMKVLANEKDFEGTDYLVIPEDSVEYKIKFDSELETEEIDKNKELSFNFLGEPITIINWGDSEMTILRGKESLLEEGMTSNGVLLKTVLSDSVYVVSGNDGKRIKEDKTGRVGSFEVKVKEVLYDERDGRISMAILIIGNDVEETIETGDEYNDLYEWVVSSDSIGIVLKEEYIELDDELKPLASGEKLCLPNDYVCIRYDGLVEEDKEELNFDLDLDDKLLTIEGNFELGLENYDELFLNLTTKELYAEDEDDNKIVDTSFNIGDFEDVEIVNNGLNLTIGDVVISFDDSTITKIEANSNSVNSEEDYLSNFGILIKGTEEFFDNLEEDDDGSFDIVVPEESAEGLMRVY